MAWLYDIYQKTGIQVSFPVIADRSGEIARKYGMMSTVPNTTETVRNVFIIDDKGVIRVILTYPLNIGRCIPEILRIIEALQTADCNDAAIPANWVPGEPIIVPKPNNFGDLQKRMEDIEKNKNGMSWYLSFKKASEKCEKIPDKRKGKPADRFVQIFNILRFDFFVHFLNISFYQRIERNAENFRHQNKAVYIRIAFVVFPVGNGLAGNKDFNRKFLL